MRITDLLAPGDVAQVARLQWTARGIVEGFCSGRHRSPHKGFSVEFKEHRSYVRGDELKSIDWKAFGKSDRLYIREYEEETNLRCHLVVDRSGSMLYRGDRSVGPDGKPISKFEYAQTVAASLAYLMLGSQDAVGAITFDHRLRDIIPIRSRPSHLRALITAIARRGNHGETDLGDVLAKVAAKVGRRGLVIILSDAAGPTQMLARPLAMIKGRHNDVVWIQINDPDELDFPFEGRVQFKDLENALAMQTVDAAAIRSDYLKRLQTHQSELQAICRRNRVDLVPMSTDSPVGPALSAYLARRRGRSLR